MRCMICGGPCTPQFQKHGYWIEACTSCGHRAANVTTAAQGADHLAAIYGEQYFVGGGDGYPDYLGEASLLRAHGRRYGKLLARHMRAGTLLDVGAAAGFLLQGFTDCGWQGVGLEPNAQMVAHGRAQLGLTMTTGDLETFRTSTQFDLISMIQVIAHFHDLRRALAQAAALTKPGGFWLIESWNRASLPARLLGNAWHEYSPPSVLHWFSPRELTALVAAYGLRPVAQGRPQKWLHAGHAKSLLRYKLQRVPGFPLVDRAMALLPDDLALPYPTLDLFWGLYQKSN